MKSYDAIVVGSGPNGLAAAIALAQKKLSVLLIEGKSTIGGGIRSQELTLPGFIHDVCSAIHPLGVGSPFFRSLPLDQHGLKWVYPSAPLAHPFTDGTAVLLEKSLEALQLGSDGPAYRNLMQPFVSQWSNLIEEILAPFHFSLRLARFGFYGIRSAEGLARSLFKEKQTQALFAGLAAHSNVSLDRYGTAAVGLVLALLAHAVNWPMPLGGAQSLANALASYFCACGGEILTDTPIKHLDELPKAKAILLDVTPKQLLEIAADRLPSSYCKRLQNFRYGPGVFKIDWALSSPIPWKDKACLRAGTVHVGGTLEEIAAAEKTVAKGQIPAHPFILMAQPTLFDPGRAPKGKHIAWGYCHVPNGSTIDIRERIEREIERYAPGFIDCILERSVLTPNALEQYNPNYIGGDIGGGIQDIYQLFTRPVASLNPYATPHKGLYICSSSTPPGGGVHGMCGYHAAQAALKNL